MAGIFWMLCLSLLVQQSFCSQETGCIKWRSAANDADVCCEECHQGHRLVKECGKDPKELCTRCESGTFTTEPKAKQCKSCRQCVGSLVLVKSCTDSSDTVCGCKEGNRCGDEACTFCVKTCGKGEEPIDRDCRPCPERTFNDQIHGKCKPWSIKCPNPDQEIMDFGDAVSDIKCVNISTPKVYSTETTVEQTWPLMLPVVFGVVLICIIIILVCKAQKRRQKKKIQEETGEILSRKITGPTSDDPQTLIAIECSFHEAQQEQGSSCESLNSKDSSEQLLPSNNRNGKN